VKIPCLVHGCTIRQRLMLLNGFTMLFVVSLVSIYTFQLVTVENNLMTIEQVDDLFSSILGLRRYEKNMVHPTKAYFVSWRAIIFNLKNSISL